MPDGLEVDRLYVVLETEFDDAIKSFNKAKETTDDLEEQLARLDDTSSELRRTTNEVEDGLDDVSESMDKLSSATKQTEKSSSDLERQQKRTKQETDEMSESADKNKSTWDDFKSALDNTKVFGLVSLGAIAGTVVTVMKEVAEKASMASIEFQEMESNIRLNISSLEDLEEIMEVVSGIYTDYAVSSDAVSIAISDLSKIYDVSGDDLDSLTRSYVEFARVSGMEVNDAVTALHPVFVKWGIDVEDQAEVMDTLFNVTKKYAISMPELISLLDSGDKGFQMFGMSIDEAAVAMGMLATSDGLDTAGDFANAGEQVLNRVINSARSEYDTASKLYQTAIDDLESATDDVVEANSAYRAAISANDADAIAEAEENLKRAMEARAIAEATKQEAIAQLESATALKTSAGSNEMVRQIIEEMRMAADEDTAIAIGAEYLGSGLASRIAGALFGGLDGYEEEAKQLSGEGVEEAYEAVQTLDDKFTILGNTINEGLVPAGDTLNGILEDVIENTESISTAVSAASDYMVGWFASVIGNTEAVAEVASRWLDKIAGFFGIERTGNENFDALVGNMVVNPMLTPKHVADYIVNSGIDLVSGMTQQINITQNFQTPEVDTYAARRGTELALAADQSSQMHRI